LNPEELVENLSPEELINKFIDLPKQVVYELISKKGWQLPPHMDRDDLAQAGCLGLIDAAYKYNKDKGPWAYYARLRIKGSIVDWMRNTSWSSRTDRVKAEQSGEELKKIYGGENSSKLVESIIIEKTRCQEYELKEFVDWFIAGLTPENKRIFIMYYAEDLTMHEVGKELNLTESAICLRLKSIHVWIEMRKKGINAMSKTTIEELLDA